MQRKSLKELDIDVSKYGSLVHGRNCAGQAIARSYLHLLKEAIKLIG
jgi:hypothetical protein